MVRLLVEAPHQHPQIFILQPSYERARNLVRRFIPAQVEHFLVIVTLLSRTHLLWVGCCFGGQGMAESRLIFEAGVQFLLVGISHGLDVVWQRQQVLERCKAVHDCGEALF